MNALTMPSANRFAPTPESQRSLRDAFGKFSTGVTVVTCASDKGPVWITANSFSSISLDPALVMWAIGRHSKRFPSFVQADAFAIHVLAENQADLCQLAAKDAYGLRDVPHGLNMAGVPLLDGCLARFECKRSACHSAGDHEIVVGEVLQVEMRDGAPLAFYAGEFGTITR